MSSSPSFAAVAEPFCLTAEGMRSREALAADVEWVRRTLVGHDAICNMVPGRYHFAVLLLAAMLNGQTTVLPPSRASVAVSASLAPWSSPLVLESLSDLEGRGRTPALPAERSGTVDVFTSGTTGMPVRHGKTWGILARGAKLTADIIARAGLAPIECVIVGTTPQQHMYGLESTMFAGLACGFCLSDSSVFYAADLETVADRAARCDGRRVVLVTTPPHLRVLEQTIRRLPSVACIISATAPLDRDFARHLECGGRTPVFEIYGSTETGSMAWRRSVESELWELHPAFKLFPSADGWFATADYLQEGVLIGDHIDCEADGRFRLLGRRGDMVRIGGKRQSLSALNAIVAATPGLCDAAILLDTKRGEDHLVAVVVPAGTGNASPAAIRRTISAHMREHCDPVFVPRQVLVVDRLPRAGTGKIADEEIKRMLEKARRRRGRSMPGSPKQ